MFVLAYLNSQSGTRVLQCCPKSLAINFALAAFNFFLEQPLEVMVRLLAQAQILDSYLDSVLKMPN